jgi:hypothetical protein
MNVYGELSGDESMGGRRGKERMAMDEKDGSRPYI